MKKNFFIISNESISNYGNKYFCDNLDIKSITEELNKNSKINLIARKSKKNRSHEINIKNIKIFNNIFFYLLEIFKTLNINNSKYLIISITPYTFLSCIFLFIMRKKPIIYLRSDGYEEYKSKIGFLGSFFYHFMFTIATKVSDLISCRSHILRGKIGRVVSPSQLNEEWFLNTSMPSVEKINLLYVGRIKIEKGIFSLLKILKNINENISLSVIGAEKNSRDITNQKNVKIYEIETNQKNLIKYYDEHNIFILPSFTEGYPQALLEALARLRPVIIFQNISHVIGNKKGIFVAERNQKDLLEKINYIKSNYEFIQNEMRNNNLPTKKGFINEFEKIIHNF